DDLGRHADGPLRGVPLAERSDAGTAIHDRLPDGINRAAGSTHGTGACDNNARGGCHGVLRRVSSRMDSSVASGCRQATQLFDPPNPNELEIAARTRSGRDFSRTMFTLQSGSAWARFAFTGAIPSRIASAHRPASTAPAAAIKCPMQLLVELT